MSYLFTSESVSEGHPDKIADQISDAILDNFLAFDPDSKVACETLVTTGQVILSGEVKSRTYIDVQKVAREVIKKIGYTKSEYKFDFKSCGILSMIHEQSDDINRGVVKENNEEQGAGDQGIMFGYACSETDYLMPAPIHYSHKILQNLSNYRKNNDSFFGPDSKSQVSMQYEGNKPKNITSIVVSTQHFEDVKNEEIRKKRLNQKRNTPTSKSQRASRGGVLRYPYQALTAHTDYLQIDIVESVSYTHLTLPTTD